MVRDGALWARCMAACGVSAAAASCAHTAHTETPLEQTQTPPMLSQIDTCLFTAMDQWTPNTHHTLILCDGIAVEAAAGTAVWEVLPLQWSALSCGVASEQARHGASLPQAAPTADASRALFFTRSAAVTQIVHANGRPACPPLEAAVHSTRNFTSDYATSASIASRRCIALYTRLCFNAYKTSDCNGLRCNTRSTHSSVNATKAVKLIT